ncbi:hypothetical protein ACIBG8_35255 [Nonomuraea sp. NPDC050556]|uniref:hypothetical protein n=1 Tax=Nonomuraea sp. NPDC050556 TaxID=3364369 RepID=UPI0037AFA1C3
MLLASRFLVGVSIGGFWALATGIAFVSPILREVSGTLAVLTTLAVRTTKAVA